MEIADRARRRFDSLRHKALSGFDITQLSTDPPAGWCVSTIGRLRTNSPGIISKVAELQDKLRTIAGLYMYPPASLHLSLLGCTQRENIKQTTTLVRVNRIGRTVAPIIRAHKPVRMHLGRLNLLGTQFFIEVTAENGEWSQLRDELAASLERIGECPISYADTEPIHLNVARILASPDEHLLKSALTDPDFSINEVVVIDKVELVLTDFTVSPDQLEVLDTIPLTS